MSTDSAANARGNANRISSLLDRMDSAGVDALLVTSMANRRYLSGFTGSSANLVIGRRRKLLITDGRYTTQARAQAPLFEIVTHTGPILDQVAQSVIDVGIERLGFDPALTTVADHTKLTATLNTRCQLVDVSGLVERLRQVKDRAELEHLRKAIALADSVMETVADLVRPGAREIGIAIRIEQEFRLGGASGPSFPVIVAAGGNAAMPHHSPSDKTLAPGDPLVVDMGALVDGYCSDMTRTFCVGGEDRKFAEIYRIVLEAQLAAIGAIRGGAPARECDKAARDVIGEAGYGDFFGHGTGHGVGLEIHEAPRVGRTSDDTLQAGMVHSVEPGIYIPDWGGVRIEDLVLVTPYGVEVLTKFRK